MTNTAVSLLVKKEDIFGRILSKFKVKHDNVSVKETPYFDIYDVRLTPGEKYKKLERIIPDLGMQLYSQSIPRGYPVYEKGIYRIEIQKEELATKTFSELYATPEGFFAPITIGVNADGSSFIKDLQKLPNLLIGGVPGSGKSVLLHSIILSLIANNAELYLVDPKMVEFGCYSNIKNVRRMINSVEETYELIREVHQIMEDRFSRLNWNGFRNIHEHNASRKKKLKPVVIVIDEWADIILQDRKVEKPLCVIAQKGRAAGISIVLATQRPSSSVISGLIKANFSGRIALRVASNVDSRVILDRSGAEKISNVGQGLYLDQRLSEAKMFKTAYVKSPQGILEEMDIFRTALPFWKKIWL